MEIPLVVLTYQERDNIKYLVERIAAALSGVGYEIVAVDDNSPDGTTEVAQILGRKYPVKVIKRSGKLGSGQQYWTDFGIPVAKY